MTNYGLWLLIDRMVVVCIVCLALENSLGEKELRFTGLVEKIDFIHTLCRKIRWRRARPVLPDGFCFVVFYAKIIFMNSEELRKKFIDFFKEKGHSEVPSSSLIPTDPSVLFTSAGMQQFKPYYLNEKSPYGDKTVSVQKCFRTSDLDSIGDETHLSFFEMLGNFSFGGYFKESAIKYAHEFITKELDLKIDYISVFEGDPSVNSGQVTPPDEESEKIWKQIDPNIKIRASGREDNFWGPTGDEGPCGPTTEIYVNGVEIWNIVFNEYFRDKNGNYEKLKAPGVDTGMGLERLTMVVQNKKNIFETDLFASVMEAIVRWAGNKSVEKNRIITDHLRAAVFLIADGITPSNTGRGYVLRRLLRRASYYYGSSTGAMDRPLGLIVDYMAPIYKDAYPDLTEKKNNICEIISDEEMTFFAHLGFAKKLLNKIITEEKYISADNAFLLHATYGLPLDLLLDLAKENNIEIDTDGFNKKKIEHQELSRTASQGMFKSGLAGHSEQEIKYHTATHLLMAALRKILGEHVFQKGSNINPERLRLDFSHPLKLTDEQKKSVEELVNEKISENLSVFMEETSVEEAKNKGALGVFEHKYGEKVSVYGINNFSREICAGPHVDKTGVLGKFKIMKEEASSAGVRRIKAILKI